MIYANCIVVDIRPSYLEFHGTSGSMNHSKFALHKTDLNWSASMVVCQKTSQNNPNHRATGSMIRFSKP